MKFRYFCYFRYFRYFRNISNFGPALLLSGQIAAVGSLSLSLPVQAHSLSTGFGQLTAGPASQQQLQLQLSLADLQLALNWSTQRDLTWSMVQQQFGQIDNYLQSRLQLHDKARQPLACVWQTDFSQWQLTQIAQQYYLQLSLQADCAAARWLHYQVFAKMHEHKALIQTAQGEQVLAEATPWLAL